MYTTTTDAAGFANNIAQDGRTVIHLNPSERTMENIDNIVDMLNEHESMQQQIEGLEERMTWQAENVMKIVDEQTASMRNEIARLRELVESAYFEGACDAIDFGITQTRLGWNDSNAKAALDGEGK